MPRPMLGDRPMTPGERQARRIARLRLAEQEVAALRRAIAAIAASHPAAHAAIAARLEAEAAEQSSPPA